MITLPNYPGDFAKFTDLRHVTGILFTTLLLSLGAPFWYGALQQLLQLRSKIAQDDDAQRKSRQTSREPVGTLAVSAQVARGAVGVESGDLKVIG